MRLVSVAEEYVEKGAGWLRMKETSSYFWFSCFFRPRPSLLARSSKLLSSWALKQGEREEVSEDNTKLKVAAAAATWSLPVLSFFHGLSLTLWRIKKSLLTQCIPVSPHDMPAHFLYIVEFSINFIHFLLFCLNFILFHLQRRLPRTLLTPLASFCD